jgi:hypothetical protein
MKSYCILSLSLSFIFFAPGMYIVAPLKAQNIPVAETPVFVPEDHYGEDWTPDALMPQAEKAGSSGNRSKTALGDSTIDLPPTSGAEADLREWVDMKYRSPEGRPLPVTGNWMCQLPRNSNQPGRSPLGWDPNYFIELIKEGHHVLPTFIDTVHWAARAYSAPISGKDPGQNQALRQIDAKLKNWRPALEYCRENKLPIVFRGWNMLVYPASWFSRREQLGGEALKLEDDLRLLVDGEPVAGAMDPLGPVEGWRQFGENWFNHPMMREIQKIYPDPPLIIFLDNNEAGKAYFKTIDQSDRFIAKYGEGPHDDAFKKKVLYEGYAERLAAMFEGAREGCISPTWSKNLRFVAYNNVAAPYDGGMPEFYDNDWQPNKRDYNAYLHSDAMNMSAFQNIVLDNYPDFHWSTIIWDGAGMSNIWRSRGGGRSMMAKPFVYASQGQRWDFDRYEGVFQFGLWMMRPKEFREFRGDPARNAYWDGAWERVLTMVDRPWDIPLLRKFWRFGELVPNRYEPALRRSGEHWSDRAKQMDRWFILKCDANPERGEWISEEQLRGKQPPSIPADYENRDDPWWDTSDIRVFSMALVLGEQPERQWLIYAHAPRGAVANATVQLPGFGNVMLDSVPVSGSFFLVTEAGRSVETVIAGAPPVIAVQVDHVHASPGTPVTFTAQVTSPPPEPFIGFSWSLWDGRSMQQDQLEPFSVTLDEPGAYMMTVTGRTQSGETVIGQVEFFIGEEPGPEVLYDLPLNTMFDWRGPWGGAGDSGEILTEYSHLPNAGSKNRALVAGGRIVEDAERGKVLEFSGEPLLNEAIWLTNDQATTMAKKGIANRTISFAFKAEGVEDRQVLYAEGSYIRGMNIYLLEGVLYAGSWGEGWPDYGSWISVNGLPSGKWVEVTLVVEDLTDQVEPDKMHLYINGDPVAKGPAKLILPSYCPPRFGGMTYNNRGNPLTGFHDKQAGSCQFKGRLSDVKYINAARHPGQAF